MTDVTIDVKPHSPHDENIHQEHDHEHDEKHPSNVEWEYCLMFGNLDPPSEHGNQLPETHPKMVRFRKNQKKREQVIERLKKPNVGLMVTRKRSPDGKAIFVLISCSQERLEKEAELIELPTKLKEEFGGGYAPFEIEDKKQYENSEKEFGFFRKSIRHYLIKSIIEGEKEYNGADINIGRLVKAGVITKEYPLHTEPERQFLIDNWASPKAIFKRQPLNEIRDYYGEDIGFYFAWLGFYTEWLYVASGVGLVAFILYMSDGGSESTGFGIWVITAYSIFLAFWATLFLEYWKRKSAQLSFDWGSEDWEESEQPRPDYYGNDVSGVYSGGHWIPLDPNKDYGFPIPKSNKYYSTITRYIKIGAGIPLLVTMLVAVVIITAAILSFRLFVETKNSFGGDLAGGVANAISIIIMNSVWKYVAVKLNDWENHRTQSDYDNSLIFKIFIFYFVNSYTSLYYMAFFKNGTRFWGVDSLTDSCAISGYGTPSLISGGCVDGVTFQLATLLGTNMVIGQAKEVLIPYIMSKIQLIRFIKETGEDITKIPQWERDSKLANYQGTLDEYSEMVIQFGYITLFASAFPLAPMMAVLNNIVEIRTDAFKFIDSTVRPDYKGATGIGNWYAVLEILGVIAVITNCLLIGYSFSGIARLFDPQNRGYYTLAVIVCMEHGILFIKYIIATLIPDVPGQVVKQIAFQKFCKEQIAKQRELSTNVDSMKGTDDLNDVDEMIAADEAEKINPFGINLNLTKKE